MDQLDIVRQSLSSQDTRSSHSLDLFFGNAREKPGLHNDGLLGKNTLAQDLAVTSPRNVNHWSLVFHSSVLQSRLFRDERPELVKVHSWLVEVRVVRVHVEVPHANLSKVTRMVLVKVDPVVVLATSVSATSRVLPGGRGNAGGQRFRDLQGASCAF